MVVSIEGDSCFQPSEPHQDGNGLNGVHLLLGDPALMVRFIGLGAYEDHQALLGFGELGLLLLPIVSSLANLLGRLMSFTF